MNWNTVCNYFLWTHSCLMIWFCIPSSSLILCTSKHSSFSFSSAWSFCNKRHAQPQEVIHRVLYFARMGSNVWISSIVHVHSFRTITNARLPWKLLCDAHWLHFTLASRGSHTLYKQVILCSLQKPSALVAGTILHRQPKHWSHVTLIPSLGNRVIITNANIMLALYHNAY